MHPEKTIFQKDTHALTFIEAPFTTARTLKQPICPSTEEWVKKWYMYTMEYYSGIKRNEFDSVLVRWVNLEPVTQSEVKSEKEKYCILMYIHGI